MAIVQRFIKPRKLGVFRIHHITIIGCIVLLIYYNQYQKVSLLRCLSENDIVSELDEDLQSGGSDRRQFPNQRVVILSGPHKTGTTSIQNSIREWTGQTTTTSTSTTSTWTSTKTRKILTEWSWPVPKEVSELESQDERNWNWNVGKGFYALAESLRDEKYGAKKRDVFQKYSDDELIQLYRTEFLRSWLMGYNIVFGTEALDFIVKAESEDGDRMVEDLKGLMPWHINDNLSSEEKSSFKGIKMHGGDESIRVVVTYRSPRIQHLISIWRQTKKEVEPFEEWILTTTNNLGALDSLGLASMYLNHGLHVDLIDSSGLEEEGVDISNAVACDILNAPCSERKQPVGTTPKNVIRMNTKVDFQGKNRLSEDQLEQMDRALNLYDCRYLQLYEENDRFRVLYPNALAKNFERCKNLKRSGGYLHQHYLQHVDRSELKRRLVCIASNQTACF